MEKNNDQIILEKIIESKIAELETEMSYSNYFEIYTASEILKDHDLTYDDIEDGIVGNGGDGGIDSIYVFLNGELLKEDTEINYNQKKNNIELVIIQSKTSRSFSEDVIVKFRETSEDLFNLASSLGDFTKRYNKELLDKVRIFRTVHERLLKTFPRVEIKYFYATQGHEINDNVTGKVPKLQETIGRLFGSAEFKFEFISARRLLEMTRNIPLTSRILEVSESPISTASGSYVCLVELTKYYEFISDNGKLARSIFESNVRDYQGSVTVNTGIKQTLSNKDSENFWYLNNGVTIITPKAVLSGKQLTIEDPQIVNGLQTSHEIYRFFSSLDTLINDERAILVRIIKESDEEARDRIIRATNSQTNIPPTSLRSSDEIHRNIEDFLKANNFYYDRKKNFYKNEGYPISNIISIPYLAQAMMSIILFKPDSARARPSTLINSDTEYEKIFSSFLPIDIYLKVIQIMKSVENFLKPNVCGIALEKKDITNIKYYVAMLVGIKIAGGNEQIAKKIANLPRIDIPGEVLSDATEIASTLYFKLGGSDQVAKGTELLNQLLKL